MILLSDPRTLIGLLLTVLGVAVVVVSLAVVPVDRRPSSATAWIIAIAFVPVLGLLAFLVIGSPRLPAHRREMQRDINRRISERTRAFEPWVDDEPGHRWLEQVVRLNRELGALPMLRSNEATLESDYDAGLAGIARDIDTAQDFVHLEFYILSHDPATADVFRAMADATARGVVVRVLLDHIGSLGHPGYRRTLAELDRVGARWQLMLPVQPLKGRYQRPDLRNHRKIVVVDGRVAWVGSMNLIDASYNKRANRRKGLQWRDLMVRVRGPVVQELDALFATDWFSESGERLEVDAPDDAADAAPDAAEAVPGPATGDDSDVVDALVGSEASSPASPGRLDCQVIPSGPGFDTENNLRMFNALLYGAQRRVSITSPYFVPDESLLYAVTSTAYRGVEVELFVPEQADQVLVQHAQRSYYGQLLRSGVRIWLYPAPYVLHAKHLSIDETIGVVGSSNLDIRSFLLNLECTMLVEGQEFADQLRAVEDGYRAVSHELTLQEWEDRPRRQRFADNLARLTSALQ